MTDTLHDVYSQRRKDILVPTADKLEAFLKDCLRGQQRVDRISARAKAVDRFLQKAAKLENGKPKYSDPLSQIQDQIGARVVAFYARDVERISKEVERYFRLIESKTIIPDSDSQFGYFGKHYIMILPKDVLPSGCIVSPPFFELQIKTLFQHAWSEANHDLGYKAETTLTADESRKIAFTAAQAWGADLIFDGLHTALAGRY